MRSQSFTSAEIAGHRGRNDGPSTGTSQIGAKTRDKGLKADDGQVYMSKKT
jgi:hypothetical protein